MKQGEDFFLTFESAGCLNPPVFSLSNYLKDSESHVINEEVKTFPAGRRQTVTSDLCCHRVRRHLDGYLKLKSSLSRLCQAREPQTANSHVVTVSGLMPSSTYNCTVTSFSYSTPSKPAHIAITTVGRWRCPVY